jgi:uncharacterized protein
LEVWALKWLMGRYASREEEIDQMLRALLFVDLYGVVKRGIGASVESYAIKQIEAFYGFERPMELVEANHAIAYVQACLELNDPQGIGEDRKSPLQGYDYDDCLFTHSLRNRLEEICVEVWSPLRLEQFDIKKEADPPSISC